MVCALCSALRSMKMCQNGDSCLETQGPTTNEMPNKDKERCKDAAKVDKSE